MPWRRSLERFRERLSLWWILVGRRDRFGRFMWPTMAWREARWIQDGREYVRDRLGRPEDSVHPFDDEVRRFIAFIDKISSSGASAVAFMQGDAEKVKEALSELLELRNERRERME